MNYIFFFTGGQGASGVAVLGDLHEFPVHPLELWGQICFQLAAQPVDMKREIHKGHISVEVSASFTSFFLIAFILLNAYQLISLYR